MVRRRTTLIVGVAVSVGVAASCASDEVDRGTPPTATGTGTAPECTSPSDCPEVQCPDMGFPMRACDDGVCGTYESLCGGAGGSGGAGGGSAGAPPCGPETCASGCCSTDGECLGGQSQDACGNAGMACEICTGGTICASSATGMVGQESTCSPPPLLVKWAEGYGDEGEQSIRLQGLDSADNALACFKDSHSVSDALVKYDGQDGAVLWSSSIVGRDWVRARVDAADNVYALSADNDELCRVHKLDADGDELWVRDLGMSCPLLAVGANGDPVLAIRFTTITLETGAYTSVGGQDVLLVELAASDGTALWGTQLGSSGDDSASQLEVAADGSLVLGGTTAGQLQVGPDTVNGPAVFVALLTAAGAPSGVLFMDEGDDSPYGRFRLDASGAAYLARTDHIFDDWVVKVDADGTELWETQVTLFRDHAVSPAGATFVVGDDHTPYVIGLAEDGSRAFTHTFYVASGPSGPHSGDASSMLRAPQGDLFIAGTYQDSIRFGDFVLPPMVGGAEQFDAFIVRLSLNPDAGL